MSDCELMNSSQGKAMHAHNAPEKKKWKGEVKTLRKELLLREEVCLSLVEKCIFGFET